MTTTKDVRGECQHCGGQFDFPAEQAGLTTNCPHCGQATELLLATPPETASPVRKKAIVFVALAEVIGVVGLVGAQLAIKRAKRMVGPVATDSTPATTQPATKNAGPFAGQGFAISEVTLESAPSSKLVYARGAITNTSAQQRFGVKVALDLFDGANRRIGAATDYVNVIEPNAAWRFRALVMETNVLTAKIAAIKETK